MAVNYNNNIGTPIYADTTMKEIRNMPEFKEISDRIIFRGFTEGTDESNLEVRDIAYVFRGGCANDLIYGLKRLQKLVNYGINVVHNVYSYEEIQKEPRKSDAKLFYFPCGDPTKPFILFISGGGFEDNWNITQAFPCAAFANEMGYNAFALDYRILRKGEKAIMPAPFEDVAAALKYIFNHKKEFNVNCDNYAVSGLSAGGTCAASWGTDNFGWDVHGLPKPAALILCYPVTVFDLNSGERLLNNMIGDIRTEEDCKKYSIIEHVTKEYPPTYICHSKNDKFVPFENTLHFVEKLEEVGVPYKLKAPNRGQHGYAIASGTMSDGWLTEAIDFWQNQCK